MQRCVDLVKSSLYNLCNKIHVHSAGDYISDIIANEQNFYEYRYLESFYEILKSNILGNPGTFIDVGCNIGNHSLFLNSIIKFQSMVLIDISKRNCILASLNNPEAIVINAAASDFNGSDEVYIYDDNSGVGTVKSLWKNDPEWGKQVQTNEVLFMTLDTLNIQKVDAVKIDVEGSEFRVLKGMKEMLTIHKPILWIEMHGDEILKRSFEYVQKDIFDFLSSFGYKLLGSGGGNYIFKYSL